MQQLFRELKRRNVYKVAAAYVTVAFVGFQAAKLLIPSTVLPPWTDEFFLFLLIIGFPVAIVVAWAFEMTPEGMRRTEAPEGEGAGSASYRWISLALVVVLAGGVWYVMPRDDEQVPPEPAAAETDTARAESLAGTGPAAPRLGDRSIAVLPFEALGQAEPDVFTEGMHDDLLARLSNISDLKVISRTAVQQYRGSDRTTGEIARELGVRWVLEGGVQEMGNEIQVNAQLIDPRTETHLWADRYRGDLTAANLFDLQSEITKKIARSLETELSPAEADRVERRPTENLDAYRLYVRGRSQLDTRTEAGMRRAVDYFHTAIERDSSYALAWSGLADARALLVVYGHAARDTLLPEALDAAERALALDPELAEAHASMGLVRERKGETVAGLLSYRRAVELKPSYARANYWLGLQLQSLGRLREARSPLKRAVALDPMSPVYHLGLSDWYLESDSLGKALEEARKHDEYGDQPSGPSKPGSILSLMGRHDEALTSLRRAVERTEPGTLANVWARLRLAHAHVRAGHRERGRELMAGIEEEERQHPSAGNMTAGVYAALGERDSAFAYLAASSPPPGELQYGRAWAPLRQDPRWQELVREINVESGLNPDGSLPEGVNVSFDSEPDD